MYLRALGFEPFKELAPLVSDSIEGATRASIHFEESAIDQTLAVISHVPTTVINVFCNVVCRKPNVHFVKDFKNFCFDSGHTRNRHPVQYPERGILRYFILDRTGGFAGKRISKFPTLAICEYPVITSEYPANPVINDCRRRAIITRCENRPEGPAVVPSYASLQRPHLDQRSPGAKHYRIAQRKPRRARTAHGPDHWHGCVATRDSSLSSRNAVGARHPRGRTGMIRRVVLVGALVLATVALAGVGAATLTDACDATTVPDGVPDTVERNVNALEELHPVTGPAIPSGVPESVERNVRALHAESGCA